MSRVVLAMSGGVDSSVAAHLLLQAGHEVVGVFMRHGEQSPAVCATSDAAHTKSSTLPQLSVVSRLDHKQGCCTAADAEDARRVSDRLGIPFYALDLNDEFGRIMDYFVAEYARGRTPNPCVQCNNWIKFGKLFDYADSIDAEYVATGHYARLEERDDGPALLRGVDASKDQSYVLAGIQRGLLKRMLLPVGGYEKSRIRELAAGIGLNVAEKKDSQEICFVTQGRYDEFVKRRLRESRDVSSTADRSGEIVTTTGEVVGHHEGVDGFTVGQRKGLGVALGKPVFVVSIDPDTRRVVLGERSELDRSELTASESNWLIEPPTEPMRCEAQIRYNSAAAPATLEPQGEGRFQLRFDSPQQGVTPGQAVVCYAADDAARVLGGGWIE
ncbi:tRNA 2-thiouridine(34) synthase MnmA [Botrimarina mediterranea]|uniref:tRNA-specific 2-thiouridylase MnmA n=1 Tax=Botrimarina mediterranea TaxID=2528022 RepID=A0A518K2N1_9BACT|nr:tRNA 2-thiouridine(34) synthase MnmA [Botrimarina mediterranea]QDV72068.1 tRNA-specific 2-thiouridylase MnmA [Botrimarina mediterranea]QDV76609.1 tRNA-specific 2-thiouridylase MnmA [Planctomycetes bacterium K2D]